MMLFVFYDVIYDVCDVFYDVIYDLWCVYMMLFMICDVLYDVCDVFYYVIYDVYLNKIIKKFRTRPRILAFTHRIAKNIIRIHLLKKHQTHQKQLTPDKKWKNS